MATNRDFQPGDRVPGTVYQVHRLIGAGGMGTVYDVEDTTIGKRYVLKTLHPDLGDRQDLARRMTAEARTLARLHHPNLVEVFTAGVTGDELRLPFYVMERLDGQTLRFVLAKKGQIEPSHAYHIAIDLLDALDHAHDKGVVHRDVKPDNIFLHRTPTGMTVTKLLDFGIMSVLDSGKNGETGGRFLGTLRYAAPEQLKGDKPTPKMDIYAAGLVLYEMLAGRGPFDDETESHKIANAHVHREAPLVSTFVQVPRAVDALLRSALAKDPAERPTDAFTFAKHLRALTRTMSVASGIESTGNARTAVAVLSGIIDSPPAINLQGGLGAPSPISPLASSQFADPVAAGAMPKTTIRGMVVPTVSGGTLESAPGSVGATLPSAGEGHAGHEAAFGGSNARRDVVDRQAPTHSLALQTPRMPHHGTDPLTPLIASGSSASTPTRETPAPAAHPSASTPPPPIVWPPERGHEGSESGQARTVSGSMRAPQSKQYGVVIAVSILGACALVGLSVVAWRMTTHAAATAPTSAATETSAPREITPVPVVTVPVATIAPPGLDDPGKNEIVPLASATTTAHAVDAGAPAKAPPPTTLAPARPPAPPRAPTPAPTPAPAPTPKMPDRPGPGF